MQDVLSSKTVRFAIICMVMDLGLIAFATVMLLLDGNVPYVPEFFGVQGLMFGGVAGKNLGDNYLQYKASTTTSVQVGGQVAGGVNLAAPPIPPTP